MLNLYAANIPNNQPQLSHDQVASEIIAWNHSIASASASATATANAATDAAIRALRFHMKGNKTFLPSSLASSFLKNYDIISLSVCASGTFLILPAN